MTDLQEKSPIPSELFNLAEGYLGRLEEQVKIVTKAVSCADEMRNYFLEKEKELKSSRWETFLIVIKSLMPFLVLIVLVGGLFFLPCGIKWNGFGVQFSTSECIQKCEFQKNNNSK